MIMAKYQCPSILFIFYYYLFILDLSSNFVQAQQRPRILEHPADAIAAREEPLTLNCKATGRPTPDISWFHNGTPLIPSERRVILPEGSLFFLRILQNKREQDAGIYWCEAKSTAGVAVSRNATLQIAMLREDFRLVPKDAVALVGGPVTLNCTPPRGIPEPSVLWYKNGKLLELNGKRLSMVDFGSLLISEVQATDAGQYECSAQSIAGSRISLPAILKVLAPPIIVRSPQDTEIVESEGFDLPCEITGDPKPIVSWSREGKGLPEGRSRILLDNTLRIEDARSEDEGRYVCRGFNEGGNVSVTITLHVYAVPSFIEAPSDVDVKEGDTIRLSCRAQGRPKVRIIWERVITNAKDTMSSINSISDNEQQQQFEDDDSLRSKIGKNITAQDEDTVSLSSSPSSSTEGNNNSSGSTNINNDIKRKKRDLNIVEEQDEKDKQDFEDEMRDDFILSEFKQIMRDETQDFDGDGAGGIMIGEVGGNERNYERKQRIMTKQNEGSSSIKKRFKRQSGNVATDELLNESSSTTGLLLFSTPQPIETESLEIEDNGDLVLRNVKKMDEGWYACGGLNEAGSIVKKIFVRVISSKDITTTIGFQLPLVPGSRWSGTEQNIILTAVKPVASDALDVTWDTTDDIASATVQLTLHYRPEGMKKFITAKAMTSARRHRLTELQAHTIYEVFTSIPQGLIGFVSNVRKGMTLDGPPSAPPSDVRVGVINNTAAYVRWSPPPQHLLNGELTGYKIQIKSNLTNKILGQMSLNATTQSVVINSLNPGGRYIASVAPLTAGGLGPYSPPTILYMDPTFIGRTPRTEPSGLWSSTWMSGIALGLLGICLFAGAIFAVYWAQRRKRHMKALQPGPVFTATLAKQQTLWLHNNSMVKPTHSLSPPLSSEYVEVAQSGAMQQELMPSSTPPEPYATVTLQRGGGIIENQKSDESYSKRSISPRSNDYSAPVVMRELMNLCDILPPPPDHPYGMYKPPTNQSMTIRTNPAALSPQPPRWNNEPPPIPSFPQNWLQQRHITNPELIENNHQSDFYSENDYESGSVLYEQCFQQTQDSNNYFNQGEPTENYYRNINMEFFENHDFEPSTPPPPCPDSLSPYPKERNTLRLLTQNRFDNTKLLQLQQLQQLQMQQQQLQLQRSAALAAAAIGQQNQLINNTLNNQPNSNHSSDSESDNQWVSRSKRNRSRSKSGERKFRSTTNNNNNNNNTNTSNSHLR